MTRLPLSRVARGAAPAAGLGALAVVAACAAGAAPGAGAATSATPSPASSVGAGAWFFRDRVLDRVPATAVAAAAGPVLRLRTSGGVLVEIALSHSIGDGEHGRGTARSIADFLATRLHGSELGQLRVFVGTQAEVNAACGGAAGVLACYARAQHRMYVPARDPRNAGPFTRDYAITHEYGHHIAAFRNNYPWRALNYGAKYWASVEYVCARARRGLLFPGNQTTRYTRDSGEGFADTYAHLHYPGVLWQFARIMRPTPASLAAVRRDVLAPWVGPRVVRMRGALSGGSPTASFAIHQGLDGVLGFRLAGPRGANFDLLLLSGGRLVRRSVAAGSSDGLAVVSCRSSPVATYTLRVVRRSGSGPFAVSAAIPG